ncbi:MAG: PEGA domain-containing protein [Myxococcales bacterium]|jgi:hypothetical protein
MGSSQGLVGRLISPALLALLFVVVWAPRARAQELVWFSQQAPPEGSPAAEAGAALRERGVVLRAGDCAEAECIPAALKRLGARLGVLVDVRPEGVQVSVVDRDGRAGAASVPLDAGAGDVAAAAALALERAERARTLGDGALLQVRTHPSGALVELDDAPVGHAPVDKLIVPGAHAVRVALPGFVAQSRDVDVDDGSATELRFELQAAPAPVARTTRAPSPLNYVVGGVLVVGGAVGAGAALGTLVQDGECVDDVAPAQPCPERVRFGTLSAVVFAASTAGLLSGAFVLLAQPFTVEVTASGSSASLTAHGHF